MNTALEGVFLEVAEAAATSEDLSLHDILDLLLLTELLGHEEGFLTVESDVSEGNRHAILG